MNDRLSLLFGSLCALSAFVFSGCGASESPKAKVPGACTPPPLDLVLMTSKQINPTAQGEPRPVVLRLYQLKDDARLENASFEAIWQNDKTTLGDDLVRMEEVQLYPDKTLNKRIERGVGVRHLAAVALFQEPKGRSWVSTFDLPSVCETTCAICDDDGHPLKSAGLSYYVTGATVDDGADKLADFAPRTGSLLGSP